jgi:3-hydroxybutyrate dehydrogenase
MFLKGKSALVTGSTSGIGLAIARALAAEGADVMLNGFGEADEIERLRGEIETASGARVQHNGADLTRPDQIASMMAEAADAFGAIDILINNAGMQHVAPVDQFPLDKWDLLIALNLSAVFHTTRLALPAMKARGWGRIINTASAHSLVASPNKAPYVAPSTASRALPRRSRWRRRRPASPSTASARAMSGRRSSRTRYRTRWRRGG